MGSQDSFNRFSSQGSKSILNVMGEELNKITAKEVSECVPDSLLCRQAQSEDQVVMKVERVEPSSEEAASSSHGSLHGIAWADEARPTVVEEEAVYRII